jgi:hypothetical protein
MKPKRIGKKLHLKKQTITSLDSPFMHGLVAGLKPLGPTVADCDTNGCTDIAECVATFQLPCSLLIEQCPHSGGFNVTCIC